MDHATQHTVSLGLPLTYLIALVTQVTPLITFALGALGVIWYLVLFYDKFIRKKTDKTE